MKPEARHDDHYEYYSYILCYVDDILVVHHDTLSILERIDKYFTLKPTSIGDPDIYLGAKLRYMNLPNGVWCWRISPSKYVQEAVQNCETRLKEHCNGNYSLLKDAVNPFAYHYEPEVDVSEPLEPDMASYYQYLIGIMQWMVELVRLDIATEVSMLSSHNAYPREGHFEAALQIMAYLKGKHNSRLALDPTYPDIDYETFKIDKYWTHFYGDVSEAITHNAPDPLGKSVYLWIMVDSDQAGDKSTRRSRTGFMIFMNMSLFNWLLNRQPTVETTVFGAEFVAMNRGVETLRGLWYKLRIMSVPIEGPSYVYGNNMSVIHNTLNTASVLKKKSNSICYHFVQEAVSAKECLTSHIPPLKNLSDLLTKVLFGQKHRNLVQGIMYDIYDHNRNDQALQLVKRVCCTLD